MSKAISNSKVDTVSEQQQQQQQQQQSHSTRLAATTASTSDQEMLTFLSAMDLPEDGVLFSSVAPDEVCFGNSGGSTYSNTGFTQNSGVLVDANSANHRGSIASGTASSAPSAQFMSVSSGKDDSKRRRLLPVSGESSSSRNSNNSSLMPLPSYNGVSSSNTQQLPIHDQTSQIFSDMNKSVHLTSNNAICPSSTGNLFLQSHTLLPKGNISSSAHSPQQLHSSMLAATGVGPPQKVLSQNALDEEMKRKKLDRNLREQQRSHRINEQITELRKILIDNGVKFEKTDKYSTLLNVQEFISTTQTHCTETENELKTIAGKIQELKEQQKVKKKKKQLRARPIQVTDGGYAADTNTTGNNTQKHSYSCSSSSTDPSLIASTPFLKRPQLNHNVTFSQNPAALAVVSLEGQFLDCNEKFILLCGFTREELMSNTEKMSLFHILDKPESVKRVCKAMSRLIQGSDNEDDEETAGNHQKDGSKSSCSYESDKVMEEYWRGIVCSKKNSHVKLTMVITLARNSETGVESFFNCTLSPDDTKT